MEFRRAIHPMDFEAYNTDEIRKEFLVQDIFIPGELKLTHTDYDRVIVGGACPDKPMTLEVEKELGSIRFLERREMGIINVGARGTIMVDGETYTLDKTDGLYVGMGSKEVVFASEENTNPARFYLVSCPAHKAYPTRQTGLADAEKVNLGSAGESNIRTLNKYIHPDGVDSCQLVMGVTTLASGNVWNSMPCHTHHRRMEIYFYFDLSDDAVVFHLMGEPDKTRHIVIRNEQAVISPSWSIHAGAGTDNYSFIWIMVGENQTFSDLDTVAMSVLK